MFNQPYFYLKEKMKKTLIEIKNLEYSSTNSNFVMKIDSFNFPSGKSLLVSGESGSGKTTFLNLLSGTILPQKGEITILGKNLSESSSVKKDKIRGDNFGIIFQTFNLLPYLSVEENILLGLSFSYLRKSRLKGSYQEEIEILMSKLSLNYKSLMNRKAHELSIGQQQRVAVARALIGSPEIILADEPTSALDVKNKEEFIKLLFNSMDKKRQSLIMVSHDQNLAESFDSKKSIHDICGIIEND